MTLQAGGQQQMGYQPPVPPTQQQPQQPQYQAGGGGQMQQQSPQYGQNFGQQAAPQSPSYPPSYGQGQMGSPQTGYGPPAPYYNGGNAQPAPQTPPPAPRQAQAGSSYGSGVGFTTTGPQYGPNWQPPAQQYPGASWQTYQQPQMQTPGLPAQPPQQQAQQQQSLEAQALAGGNNAQQTQNLLRALQASGAGSNNQFMNAGMPAQQQRQQIIGAPVSGNGNSGFAQYADGFNGGQNDVSYNMGMGARAPTAPQNVFSPPPVDIRGAYGGPVQNGMGLGQSQGSPWAGAFGGQAPQAGSQTGYGALPPAVASGAQSSSGTNVQQSRPSAQAQPQQYAQTTPYSQNIGSPQQQAQAQGYGFQTGIRPLVGAAGGVPTTTTPDGQATLQMAQPNGQQQYLVSDATKKTAVTDGQRPLRGMLSKLGVHEYEYKNPEHGVGRFVSPMAQELLKTELGKTAVVKSPEGHLMVDYGRLGALSISAAVDLHKRVKELERGVKLKSAKKVK